MFVLPIAMHSFLDIPHKLSPGDIMLGFHIEFLFKFSKFIEPGLHFRNFFFGVIDLVSDIVVLLQAVMAFDVWKFVCFSGLDAFLLVVAPEGLIVDVSSHIGSTLHRNNFI